MLGFLTFAHIRKINSPENPPTNCCHQPSSWRLCPNEDNIAGRRAKGRAIAIKTGMNRLKIRHKLCCHSRRPLCGETIWCRERLSRRISYRKHNFVHISFLFMCVLGVYESTAPNKMASFEN